jgi:hypothetical protein
VTFSWSTPSNNGSSITGYDVAWKKEDTSRWRQYSVGNRNSWRYNFYDPDGEFYEGRVRAVNDHGAGSWSDTAIFDMPDEPDDVDDDCIDEETYPCYQF